MKLQRNIGALDRALRIVFGSALLLAAGLAFIGLASEWAKLGLFGVIPLAAGLVGFCPPYAMIGVDTSNTRVRGKQERTVQNAAPVVASDASIQPR